jgi:hypothetical protein
MNRSRIEDRRKVLMLVNSTSIKVLDQVPNRRQELQVSIGGNRRL